MEKSFLIKIDRKAEYLTYSRYNDERTGANLVKGEDDGNKNIVYYGNYKIRNITVRVFVLIKFAKIKKK